MKKFTAIMLSIILVAMLSVSFAGCSKNDDIPLEDTTAEITNGQSKATVNSTSDNRETEETKEETTKEENTTLNNIENVAPSGTDYMSDALFIGDSRTIGLSEYSGLPSDFFASVGMSVYNIHDKPISVPSVGKLTLEQLLESKTYGKIYVMLGINEIGYDFENTVKKYKELIDEIKESQPNAKIFIEANLHVTKEKSDGEKYINNKNLDKFNSRISSLADNKNIFYLNANTVFDDGEGNLAADKTSDKVHLYAKYYIQWAGWIESETKNILI